MPIYVFNSRINPEEWFKDKYAVDEVHFNEDTKIYDILKANGAAKLYLLVRCCIHFFRFILKL